MNRRPYLTAIPACLAMLLLILDSRCALQSCRTALELCITAVIPSLFPFLFLSAVITDALWGRTGRIMVCLGRLFNLPSGGESLLIPAILGGYPAGAKAVADSFRGGRLDQETAQKLLSFCSNAGPAFLFGMLGQAFAEKRMLWALWGIHILSAMLAGSFYRFSACRRTVPRRSSSISRTVTETVKTMAVICGWILLFSILNGYLDRWVLWYFSPAVRSGIHGFLELSTGCCGLGEIADTGVRFVLCSAMLSFGGLCVMLQTASVTDGLPVMSYLRGKFLQTVFSILLSSCIISGWGTAAVFVCCGILFWNGTAKKRSRFPAVSSV